MAKGQITSAEWIGTIERLESYTKWLREPDEVPSNIGEHLLERTGEFVFGSLQEGKLPLVDIPENLLIRPVVVEPGEGRREEAYDFWLMAFVGWLADSAQDVRRDTAPATVAPYVQWFHEWRSGDFEENDAPYYCALVLLNQRWSISCQLSANALEHLAAPLRELPPEIQPASSAAKPRTKKIPRDVEMMGRGAKVVSLITKEIENDTGCTLSSILRGVGVSHETFNKSPHFQEARLAWDTLKSQRNERKQWREDRGSEPQAEYDD